MLLSNAFNFDAFTSRLAGTIASWKIHLLAILHDDIDLAIG
jgi:hypothetical protein